MFSKRLLGAAVVLAGFLAFSNLSGAGTNPGNPRIITGFKDGPVVINDDFQVLGQQELARGNWLITAKLYGRNNDTSVPTNHLIKCALVGLPDTDSFRVVTLGTTAFDYLPLVLTGGVHFGPGGGTVKLRCRTSFSAGETSINFIKMTAIRVGKLTVMTAGGASETYGEGKPAITTVYRKRPLELSSDAQTVLTLKRPQGQWFALARGTFHNSDNDSHFADATCVLRGGPQSDRAILAPMQSNGGEFPFFHLLTTELGPQGGAVRLRCFSETAGDNDPVFVQRSAVTVMKVGKLTQHTTGGQTDSGHGTPRVVSGKFPVVTGLNGGSVPETLATVPIPAGEWTLYGKVSASQGGGPPAVLITCTLAAGPDFDRTRARIGFSQHMAMNVSHVFDSAGVATIQCSSDGVDDQTYARDVRIVAIKSSALTNSPLAP